MIDDDTNPPGPPRGPGPPRNDDADDSTRFAGVTASGRGAAAPGPGDATAATQASFGGAVASGQPTFAPGSILSHTYRIERFLARGGMGEVYKAQHNELGTWHAIKIILPELADNPKIIDLFRREAGVLRNVRHDAVVAYDGVFRDENGRVYLVMEFVDGISLSDILKQRALSAEEVRLLRDRVASGLGAAHETGVVHRDMSPDNIIIAGERVEDSKIIDFGIAKLADPGQATIIGDDFAGKYSYVSPEQLGMFGGQVDARSDIYSVGLILAAAARGRALDMGDSPLSVIEARKTVPDLSGIPRELVEDLSAMLQPDPNDRPQSMAAVIELGKGRSAAGEKPPAKDSFWEELELEDEPEEPRPDSRRETRERPKPKPSKSKDTGGSKSGVVMAVLLGVLVLAGASAGGYYAFLAPGTDPGGTVAAGDDTTGTDNGTHSDTGTTGTDSISSAQNGSQTQDADQIQTPPQPVQDPVVNDSTTSNNVVETTTTTAEDTGQSDQATVNSGQTTSDQTTSAQTTSAQTTDSGTQNQDQVALVPLPDPTKRDQAIQSILQSVSCGSVGARFLDAKGSLSVVGHLASQDQMQALRARLLDLEGVNSLEDVSLVTLPKPQCTVVETLPTSGLAMAPEQARAAPRLGRASQAGTLSFRGGEFLKLQLESPAYHSYYYVDYFDSANNVIHLLPSPVAQLNRLEPNQTFHIGGTDRYTIGPPYGLDLVVAVGSSVPLFDRARPELEQADVYLADLMQALASAQARTPDFVGEYSYVFVQTRE